MAKEIIDQTEAKPVGSEILAVDRENLVPIMLAGWHNQEVDVFATVRFLEEAFPKKKPQNVEVDTEDVSNS